VKLSKYRQQHELREEKMRKHYLFAVDTANAVTHTQSVNVCLIWLDGVVVSESLLAGITEYLNAITQYNEPKNATCQH